MIGRLRLVALTLLILASGNHAWAQDYPSRTVRLVVAFPAGGPTDFVARVLADKLKALLGQSVIIENKPGANAAIGAEYVAKSDPDGHTLFFTTASAVVINPHMRTDLPYDPVNDFAPVTLVVNTMEVLVVRDRHADQIGERAGRAGEVAPRRHRDGVDRRRQSAASRARTDQGRVRRERAARPLSRLLGSVKSVGISTGCKIGAGCRSEAANGADARARTMGTGPLSTPTGPFGKLQWSVFTLCQMSNSAQTSEFQRNTLFSSRIAGRLYGSRS